MEAMDIIMIAGLVLVIASLVLMYRCARRKSSCMEMEELAGSLTSDRADFEYKLRRFDSLLGKMADGNESITLLKDRTDRLQETVAELEEKRGGLETSVASLTDIQSELRKSCASLVDESARLRYEISCDKRTLRETERHIDMLKGIKEGLEIALCNIPAEEVHYLSRPVFSMGITPSVSDRLKARGILYIGDLIELSEQHLMETWGVGPVTIERIKTKLKENGVWFGMDVIRVADRWYRRKRQSTAD